MNVSKGPTFARGATARGPEYIPARLLRPYLRRNDARTTAQAVEAEGRRGVLIPGDVRSAAFCSEAVDSIEDITDEQLDRTFRTNIFGYFHMTRAALRHLKPGSAIVNCGSITGLDGSKQLLDYSASKGAIHAFTKALAQNLVDKKIRVNCVSPTRP